MRCRRPTSGVLASRRHQLRHVAAFARALSAGRFPRQLRGGAGPAGSCATSCNSGSPSGYEPLRRYLLDEARAQGLAASRRRPDLITNGCQQALDLIGRVLLRPGDTVAVEDPVYTGLKNLLTGMGAQLAGNSSGRRMASICATGARAGARAAAVAGGDVRISRIRPGATLPLAVAPDACWRRRARPACPWWKTMSTASCATRARPVPAIKQLDEPGDTVLLRSFSKIAFRVCASDGRSGRGR